MLLFGFLLNPSKILLKVASGGFYGVWLLIMEIRARTREAAPSTRR